MEGERTMHNALFPFGHIVTSPGALAAIEDAGQHVGEFLTRHGAGDWGEVDEQHRQENARAVARRLRLLSIYRTRRDEELWCITAADRSVTLVVLPEEYVYPGERRAIRRSAGPRRRETRRP
jgi:hypothetical protein